MGEWVVAVDIGNSRTKFGLFQNRQLKSHNSIEGTDEAAVLSHAQHILDSTSVSFSGLVWKLAGVVPLRLKTLENFLVSLGQDVIVLASSACIMPMDFEQKNSVGVDRLLACIAAWKSVPLGHSCIVVDAGTALTINRVSPNGFFCGGSIQPGWMLMARSLRNGTSQLPMLDFTNLDPGWPGQDTSSAIRAGLCLVDLKWSLGLTISRLLNRNIRTWKFLFSTKAKSLWKSWWDSTWPQMGIPKKSCKLLKRRATHLF